MTIEWQEADAEALPFPDDSFDVVVSQFGHMFAPRPAVAIGEMLRVLKPGGRIAFSTWPPELVIGLVDALAGRVYRSDTPDASHMPVFHQIEGLVIDRDITTIPGAAIRDAKVRITITGGRVVFEAQPR